MDDGSAHPFGQLITVRRAAAIYPVGAVILGLLVFFPTLVTVAGISDLIANQRYGHPLNHHGALTTTIVGLTLALGLGGLAVYMFCIAVARYRFYERGAVVARFGRERCAVRYAELERMRFAVTRRYYNGAYAGTTLDIHLRDHARRNFVFHGRHKEKPKGFSLVSRNFKGEDELDVVRMIIAEAMAERWVERLLAGETIGWRGTHLTSAGVVPKRGPLRGECISYSAIGTTPPQRGRMQLVRNGGSKGFLSVELNADNAWPGLAVIQRFQEAAEITRGPALSAHAPAPTIQ